MSNQKHSFDLGKLKDALALMQPATCSVETAFEEIYPLVKASLDRGVTKKAILETLSSLGMKLHPAKFKTLSDKAASRQLSKNVPATQTSAGGRK